MIALRDEALRAQLRDRERRVRRAFADLIDHVAEESGISLPLPSHDVAAILLALGDGITAQHRLDPEKVDANLFEKALGLFISASNAPPT